MRFGSNGKPPMEEVFKKRQRLVFEILEPRILLSADAFGVSLDQVDDGYADYPAHLSDDQFVQLLQSRIDSLNPSAFSDSVYHKAQGGAGSTTPESPIDLHQAAQVFGHSDSPAKTELVIIDSGVENAEFLMSNLAQEEDTRYVVKMLGADEDGMGAVTDFISDYTGVSGVHLVSHGDNGQLSLGNTELNLQNVDQYSGLFSTWRGALSADADILVYGCNFAAGEEGAALASYIAAQTGADVAASTDVTGHWSRGGDWELEFTTGQVQSALVFNNIAQQQWQGALLDVTVTSTEDSYVPLGTTRDDFFFYGGDPNEITLRHAIIFALNSGDTSHNITFNLPEGSVINLHDDLPGLTNEFTIQAADGVTPFIIIDGSGAAADIFVLNGNYNTIKGLEITGGTGTGIVSNGNYNNIHGNFIHGMGGDGIELNSSTLTQVGGANSTDKNVISDNGRYGISISGYNSVGPVIKNNYIGTDWGGAAAMGNQLGGLRVFDSSQVVTIGGEGAGNVISGNLGNGIDLSQSTKNVQIIGNFIGLDASGNHALTNTGHGIEIRSVSSGYYGPEPNDVLVKANKIAFNGGDGISVTDYNSAGAVFSQNLIYGNGGIGIDLGNDGVTANDFDDHDAGPNYLPNFPVVTSLDWNGSQLTLEVTNTYHYEYDDLTFEVFFVSADYDEGYGEATRYIGSYQIPSPGITTTHSTAIFNTDFSESGFITMTTTGFWGTSEFSENYAVTVPVSNHVPTGDVVMTGTAVQGALLTASHNLSDPNGMTSSTVVWQWRRNGVDIAGANNAIYTLTQDDVDQQITVVASYTDDDGFANEVASNPTAAVDNINDSPVGTVSVTGIAAEDQALAASDTITDADGKPATLYYQWYRDGVAITGATADQYTLTDADVGQAITVTASYTDDYGTAESVTSAATAPVTAVNDAPTGQPGITGNAQQGSTLSVDNTFTDADGLPGIFSYQWFSDGVAIAGATSDQLTLSQAEVGKHIHVNVAYQDQQGFDEQVSSAATAAVSNINDEPVGSLALSGNTLEGETLRAEVNFGDLDGLPATLEYQWYRDGISMSGATGSSYTLTDDDVGSVIHATVSYTDNFGAAESVSSAPTAMVSPVNDAPTGGVAITGTPEPGQIIGLDLSALRDADGLPDAFTYQWYAIGVAIEGATDNQYLLTAADVGKNIYAVVTYVDGQGFTETVTSNGTPPIIDTNDAPVGSVTVTGVAEEDQQLTADINITDSDGVASGYSYQWYRDGQSVAGANAASYTLGDDDVGSIIYVRVSYVDGLGNTETLNSAGTAAVTNINDAVMGEVTIAGNAQEGETLTFSNNLSDDDGLGVFSYQWFRDGSAVAGANTLSYTLGDDDVGARISVQVSYTDARGTAEQTNSDPTAAVANVNDAPLGNVTVGGLPQEDQLLTAGINFTDADGIASAFSYQWYRNNTAIAGANDATYLLGDDDTGARLHLTVQYTDAYGTQETVTSAATVAVTGVNDDPLGTVAISGNPIQGNTLSADIDITDADGISSAFTYQWYRDGVAVAGATAQTYTTGIIDAGATLHVVVGYTDDGGNLEQVASAQTEPVAHINTPPDGAVTIVGEPIEDSTLQAAHSLTDADGISGTFSYQWYRNGEAIAGATGSSYTLEDDDTGTVITVEVHYVDDHGTAERATSTASASVVNINDAPGGTLSITGQTIEDERLSVAVALTDADGIASSYSYQWYRNGEAIQGAINDSYVLTAADAEQNITVSATYTDGWGSVETVTSAATNPITMVNHLPEGRVQLAGLAWVGSELNIQHNIVDADGVSEIAFQWHRDGEPIPGATGMRYELTEEDENTTISVLASYTDHKGYDEVVMSSLAEVLAAPEPIPESNLVTVPDSSATVDLPELTPTTPDAVAEADAEAAAQEAQPPITASESAVQSQTETDYAAITPSTDILDASLKESRFDSIQDQYSLAGLTAIDTRDNDDVEVGVDFSTVDPLVTAGFDTVIPSFSEQMELLRNSEYNVELNDSIDAMQESSALVAAVVGGTTAVSTGLSVGYVIWTLRSSILVTSLLSSMPAWRFIDPLPILSGANGEGDVDDESLESLVAEKQPEPEHQQAQA